MAKQINYDGLSQVDGMLRKYFSNYLAPTLIKEQKILNQKKEEEIRKIQPKYKSADQAFMYNGGIGLTSRDLAVSEAMEKGTWNKKNTEDLLNASMAKWYNSPKLKNDIENIATAFYVELCKARNGGRESDRLHKYAVKYVTDRLNDLMTEQLARQKLPKGTFEYICQHAFDGSLMGLALSSNRDEKVNKKVEELYNANNWEKGAGIVGSVGFDAMVGGVGIGGSAIKFVGTKLGLAAGKAAVVGKAGAVAVDGAFHLNEYSKNDVSLEDASASMLGDKDAAKKIRAGSTKYVHRSGDIQQQLNGYLNNKVKMNRPTFAAASQNNKYGLLGKHKGNSRELFNDIKSTFSRQAIPFSTKGTPPGWMLKLSEKENRRMSAYYYGVAMEMSRDRKEWISVGGKRMTLREVAQKAIDYGNVASMQCKAREAEYNRVREQQRAAHERKQYYAQLQAAREEAASQAAAQSSSPQQNQQAQQAANKGANTDGWSNSLDQLGLGGFSETSKNLGYVLAMLPDMIIGMFTGKNPDLKMENNLMPLAAIMGGLLVKRNPLLKMVLMGYGGLNLFNSAGKAALKQQAEAVAPRIYKTYSDETLNSRIRQPVVKGNSLLATIDGSPMVIRINDEAIDAYNKGHIPLNKLANATLEKLDESSSKASQQYEQGVASQEEVKVNRQLK